LATAQSCRAEGEYVGSWHFSAVPTAPSNVGYRG
jgi:hypothetical protein